MKNIFNIIYIHAYQIKTLLLILDSDVSGTDLFYFCNYYYY